MSLLALTAAALLSQADPSAEAPVPAEPAAVPAAAAASPDPAAPAVPKAPRGVSSEELLRQLERIRKLPPNEASDAMQDIARKFPHTDAKGTTPDHEHPENPNLMLTMGTMTEPEQVKYAARMVFNSIIAGDARGLVLQSAYPFQLEDRRLEMPDELHKEWLKNLRTKRTDLLTIYDIEVLSPAEMEKKYGRPPARLAALPWKAPRTMIAVGNISGHAAIAVFRGSVSGRWQLVGYHD